MIVDASKKPNEIQMKILSKLLTNDVEDLWLWRRHWENGKYQICEFHPETKPKKIHLQMWVNKCWR